jgi:hypothetical protein
MGVRPLTVTLRVRVSPPEPCTRVRNGNLRGCNPRHVGSSPAECSQVDVVYWFTYNLAKVE